MPESNELPNDLPNELPNELKGRTALVTGAGTGIGRAIATELARAGAGVVCVGRTSEALEETRAAIAAAATSEGGSGEAYALPADIRDTDWLARLADLAPVIDILVNNAAAFATYGPLERVPQDEVDNVLATDLTAPLRLCAHVLPGMKERGFGRIVNIGSVAGALGADGQVAYSTAKAALYGLTRSLALEAGPYGVTCNLLDLGLVETRRTKDVIAPAIQQALIANTPVGRAGTPEEVAHVARFIASPRASYVNGACIAVSGGLELGLFPRRG